MSIRTIRDTPVEVINVEDFEVGDRFFKSYTAHRITEIQKAEDRDCPPCEKNIVMIWVEDRPRPLRFTRGNRIPKILD